MAFDNSIVLSREVGTSRCAIRRCLRDVLAAYGASTLLVVLGVLWGHAAFIEHHHTRSPRFFPETGNEVADSLTQWDGQWYLRIAKQGYDFEFDRASSAAFFPAYPLLSRWLSAATGLRAEYALLLVAHACLVASLVVLTLYVRERFPGTCESLNAYVLLAGALFPTMLFARMAYSESLFLFLCVLAFYGMARSWPALVIALIIGISSATRPTGVVLLAPLLIHVWQTSRSRASAVGRLAYLLPTAIWGLLAYSAFLWVSFDEPLAFVKAQMQWVARPPFSTGEHLRALATLEPLWSVYDPSSPAYWQLLSEDSRAWFSLDLANPLFFVAAAGLVGLGGMRKWLNGKELLFAAGLLLATYVLRGHEMCMLSQGRFVAVVFPVYLVLGNLLRRSSPLVAGGLLGVSAWYLLVYSAMLAAGYVMI